MGSLKSVLHSKPGISSVYFNEAGEWVFFPRAGFDKALTREEALELPDTSDGEPAPLPEGKAPAKSQELEDLETGYLDALSELETAQSVLAEAKTELGTTQTELATVKTDLESVRAELTKSKSDLAQSKTEVKDLTEKLKAAQAATKNKSSVDDITS